VDLPPEHLRKIIKDHGDMSSRKVPSRFAFRQPQCSYGQLTPIFFALDPTVPNRQTSPPWSPQIRPSRRPQAPRKHSHAMGTGQRSARVVSHQWSDNVR
jgi:hypothetical protein